jgi:hAT family C-terminal dimerisation region
VVIALKNCKEAINTAYKEMLEQNGDVEMWKIKWKALFEMMKFVEGSRIVKSNGNAYYDVGGGQKIVIKDLPEVEGAPNIARQVRHCILDAIKESATAAEVVMKALDERLPPTKIMEALCIITPRYWVQLQLDHGDDFVEKAVDVKKHVATLIEQFGHLEFSDDDAIKPKVIKKHLDEELVAFVTYMSQYAKELILRVQHRDIAATNEQKIECAGGDEVDKLWSHPIPPGLSEYARLANLILAIPFGSVENERRFSQMNRTCTDLRNRLGDEHLNTSIRVGATTFTKEDFPFFTAYLHWKDQRHRRGELL